MDFVATIAKQLDIPPAQAQAIAGTVLGMVRTHVVEQAGPEAGMKLNQAVPELPAWSSAAHAMLGAQQPAAAEEGGWISLIGQVAGSAVGQQLAGAIGGKDAQQTAVLVALFGKLGLDSSKALLVAPLALEFLQARLPPEWIELATAAAPILLGTTTPAPAATDSTLGNVLGKLF